MAGGISMRRCSNSQHGRHPAQPTVGVVGMLGDETLAMGGPLLVSLLGFNLCTELVQLLVVALVLPRSSCSPATPP